MSEEKEASKGEPESEPTNAAGATVSEGAPKDPTPPFTQAVPNPPVGAEAEERLARNIEAAEQRGDSATAEGYKKQADETEKVSSFAAPATPGTPPSDKAGEVRAP